VTAHRSLNGPLLLLLVALVAIPRLYLIAAYPAVAGDSDNYKNVAANILRGCGLSMSPANGPECVPHQGGQNFPGLPFFIAFVWLLFGRSDTAILLTQLAFYLGAVAWLLAVVSRLDDSRPIAITSGILLAVSAMTMPWVRFVAITDVLSVTASIWVLAEILLSVQTGRLQALRLGLAFASAVFMRVENVLFLLPIAVTAVYTSKDRFRQASVFIVTAAVPFGVFVVRNISVGLPAISSRAEVYTYAIPVYPTGFFSWLDTWMVTEYERADAIMGVWGRKYSNILIEDSPLVGATERARAESLLNELKAYDGGPFPEHIDEQFKAMADEKRRSQTIGDRLMIYLKRARTLWLNPYSSYGFPIETENREHRAAILRQLSRPGLSTYVAIVREYPSLVWGRILIFSYKVVILLALTFGVLLWGLEAPLTRKIVLLVALTVVSRTVALVLMGSPPQLETRYVISVVPWLDVLCAYLCVRVFMSRSAASAVVQAG